MKPCASLLFAMLALCAGASERFSYKGRLARADGAAFDTSLPMRMTFRLYSQESGGAPLWGRTIPARMDADGSFCVELGDDEGSAVGDARFASLADALAASPLGVWIALAPLDYSEMSPRQRLNPVPCALTAGTAAKAQTLAAERLVADGLAVTGESTISSLTVRDGGSVRRSSSDASLVMEAQGERVCSAGGEIRVTGSITGIRYGRYGVDSLPYTAPNDMFVLWSMAGGLTGSGHATLIYPKGSRISRASQFETFVTMFGKGF